MGGTSRRGPFRAVGTFSAIAVMGGDHVDLREAEIEGGELTIRVYSVLGAVSIYVPDSVEVELGGFSILGANREKGSHRRRPAAKALELAAARHLSVVAGHHPVPASASSRRHPHRGAKHHGSHHHRHH